MSKRETETYFFGHYFDSDRNMLEEIFDSGVGKLVAISGLSNKNSKFFSVNDKYRRN